jgi:hypothetical protein
MWSTVRAPSREPWRLGSAPWNQSAKVGDTTRETGRITRTSACYVQPSVAKRQDSDINPLLGRMGLAGYGSLKSLAA